VGYIFRGELVNSISRIWIVLAILFTVIAVNVAASASVTYTFQDTYIVNVGDTNVETVKDSFVAVLDNYATTPDTPLYEGWYSPRYPANCVSVGWQGSTGRCMLIQMLRVNTVGWHLSDNLYDSVAVCGETGPGTCNSAPVSFPLGTFSTIGTSHVSYSDVVFYEGVTYNTYWDADLAVSNGILAPEPSSLILLVSGALSFTSYLRRRPRI